MTDKETEHCKERKEWATGDTRELKENVISKVGKYNPEWSPEQMI